MIRVVVVDDSPLIRGLLSEILNSAPDIEVVAVAEDPFVARDVIKQTNPDVITLDIEMPKMNGISFLKNLMRLRPMPVVMISTLTQEGAPATLEALEQGAVDFVQKPTQNVISGLKGYTEILHEKIRVAARSKIRTFKSVTPPKEPIRTPSGDKLEFKLNYLVAIGASTGGTEAIKEVLLGLPAAFPPIVIAQHIPPVFSASFAQRMNDVCPMNVKEAEHGEVLNQGCVYIAPGDYHLTVVKQGGRLVCQLDQTERVNRHRPAVDVLFDSLCFYAKNMTCVMLTGMGSDGAKGMLALKESGAFCIAQDQATSVVWGMPKAAVEIGAADSQLPLDKIARKLMQAAAKNH